MRIGLEGLATLAAGAALTFAYCWAVWWLAGLFVDLAPDPGARGMLSVVLIAPMGPGLGLQALHWQLLAAGSFLIQLVGVLRISRSGPRGKGRHALPLACHAAWILALFLLNTVGVLASVVAVVPVIP